MDAFARRFSQSKVWEAIECRKRDFVFAEKWQRIRRWLSSKTGQKFPEAEPLRRLELTIDPSCVYAIGDIHGCIDALRRLEAKITQDAGTFSGVKLLVYLGDYIDRGPDSAAVIEHLLSEPPTDFRRLCLSGNHEAMLLDLFAGRIGLTEWARLGGEATLFSYGFDLAYLTQRMHIKPEKVLKDFIDSFPPDHLEFLKTLPVSFSTRRYIFTHAGVRPGLPLKDQTDRDLMWIRAPFHDATDHGLGKTVVHGHTPTLNPIRTPFRICVDTGAYMGGTLTAVRLRNRDASFLSVPGSG